MNKEVKVEQARELTAASTSPAKEVTRMLEEPEYPKLSLV